jgi:hypothetical protein
VIKNMGQTDRIVRVAVAVVALLLILTGVVGGALAWILGIIAVVLLATSAVGFCPLYRVLGFRTGGA